MNVTRSIEINAPLDKVWQVSAHQFDNISVWASLVSESEAIAGQAPLDGPNMAGRACNTSFGKTSEVFQTYDEKNHSFTYAVDSEGQPGFIKNGSNTWKAERLSSNRSRLSMSIDMELNLFPGALMRLPMSFQMRKLLDMNLEEIKHYIETGKPHPRKVKAMQKR